MKRHALAVLSIVLVTACSESGFKGKSSITETPAAAPAPKESGNVEATKEEDSGDYKQCLLAVGGDIQSVVSVSQGDVDVSQLTPNSVLYLKVQGQAKIDLTAAEISTLKGVCIEAAGQAALSLDLNATVSALYYYGRGEAITTLNFRDQGTLAKLQTDLAGASRLSLSGQNLSCDALKLDKAGSAKVDCNGAAL
jgi:hypothetical protein